MACPLRIRSQAAGREATIRDGRHSTRSPDAPAALLAATGGRGAQFRTELAASGDREAPVGLCSCVAVPGKGSPAPTARGLRKVQGEGARHFKNNPGDERSVTSFDLEYDTLRLELALGVPPPGAGKSRLASSVAECRGIRPGAPFRSWAARFPSGPGISLSYPCRKPRRVRPPR